MLAQCCDSVADGEPALIQRQINVACFMSYCHGGFSPGVFAKYRHTSGIAFVSSFRQIFCLQASSCFSTVAYYTIYFSYRIINIYYLLVITRASGAAQVMPVFLLPWVSCDTAVPTTLCAQNCSNSWGVFLSP